MKRGVSWTIVGVIWLGVLALGMTVAVLMLSERPSAAHPAVTPIEQPAPVAQSAPDSPEKTQAQREKEQREEKERQRQALSIEIERKWQEHQQRQRKLQEAEERQRLEAERARQERIAAVKAERERQVQAALRLVPTEHGHRQVAEKLLRKLENLPDNAQLDRVENYLLRKYWNELFDSENARESLARLMEQDRGRFKGICENLGIPPGQKRRDLAVEYYLIGNSGVMMAVSGIARQIKERGLDSLSEKQLDFVRDHSRLFESVLK